MGICQVKENPFGEVVFVALQVRTAKKEDLGHDRLRSDFLYTSCHARPEAVACLDTLLCFACGDHVALQPPCDQRAESQLLTLGSNTS